MKIRIPLQARRLKYVDWDPSVGRALIVGPGAGYMRTRIDLMISNGGIRDRLTQVPFNSTPYDNIRDMTLALYCLQEKIPAGWPAPELPPVTELEERMVKKGAYV